MQSLYRGAVVREIEAPYGERPSGSFSKLRTIPEGSHVVLDGTKALFIDHDILEVAEDFKKMAQYKNITLEVKNF